LTDHMPADATEELVIERSFDAPRELVFEAFTDPDQVAQWWGPEGFTTPRDKVVIDPRPGGRYDVVMVQSGSGAEFPTLCEIVELVEPELLVLKAAPQPELGLPEATITRIEFHDEGETTRISFTSGPFTPSLLDQARAGWTAQLDNLVQVLARRPA
jgi:uncharacterized protein YndB with AHSA1/START domain